MQQTQMRPPRTRSSGGRTLMLLGLVLALAAAAIVFYITTSVQGTFTQTVQVVEAKTDLKPGIILTVTPNPNPQYMLTTDAFGFETVNKNAVPPGAVTNVTQDQLNAILSNQVIVQQFLQGDILRNNDPRLALSGTASSGSLTNINPTALGPGKVLLTMKLDNGEFGVQPGDMVDIVIPVKDPKTGNTGAEVFNPQPILVYAVDAVQKGKITLVVDEALAVQLVALQDDNIPMTLVIRTPKDTTPAPPVQTVGPVAPG